jgi:hypothetical protein
MHGAQEGARMELGVLLPNIFDAWRIAKRAENVAPASRNPVRSEEGSIVAPILLNDTNLGRIPVELREGVEHSAPLGVNQIKFGLKAGHEYVVDDVEQLLEPATISCCLIQ